MSVGHRAIDAARAIEVHSGPVAKNEPVPIGQFVTAAGAAVRAGTGAVPLVPLEDHVTEREPLSLFPRAPAIDLAEGDSLLEKTAPPGRIGGDFRRSWVPRLPGLPRELSMGFLGNPQIGGWVTRVTPIAPGLGAVTLVTFGSAARVTRSGSLQSCRTARV
jgi:hypothetical protein